MSLLSKVLRLRQCGYQFSRPSPKYKYKGLSVFHQSINRTVNKCINPLINGTNISKVRYYATQKPEQNLEELEKKQKAEEKLDEEFLYIDSIIKRGSFIANKLVNNLFHRVYTSVGNGIEISPSQTLFLLRCCGVTINDENEEARMTMALKIWDMFQNEGISLDISHYNCLLQLYLENEYKFSPAEFLAMLKEKYVQPNQVTYSRLIAKYCQAGDIDGANKILEFMKTEELPITEYIFNHLVLGNARAKDMEGAKTILEVMKQSDCPPSPDTYSMLLLAYGENGDIEMMKELLSECRKEDILFSNSQLLNLVCILSANNHQEAIQEILASMGPIEGFDNSLQITTLNLLRSGHDEIAFQVAKTTKIHKDRHYQMNFFLRQLASTNIELHKVVKYCDEVVREGWNCVAFEVTLETYLINHKFDFALGLLRQMKERGIGIKEHYYYPIICHLGQQNKRQELLDLLEEMINANISMDVRFLGTFFIPNLKPSPALNDLQTLYKTLLSHSSLSAVHAYNGIVLFLLKNNYLEAAGKFVSALPKAVFWSNANLLAVRFLNSGNIESTIAILRQMLPLSIRMDRGETDAAVEPSQYAGVRDFLTYITRNLKDSIGGESLYISFLKAMESEGIRILPSIVDDLVQELGSAKTPEIEELLQKLSDPALSLKIRKNVRTVSFENQDQRGSETLGKLITAIKHKNMNVVEATLTDLKCEEVVVPPPVLVLLLSMYVEEKKIQQAENVLQQIFDEHPNFVIHSHNVIKFAALLIENNRVHDASKYLMMSSPENGQWTEETRPMYDEVRNRQIREMLDKIAEYKDPAGLKLVVDVLCSRKFCAPSVALGHMVQYHLDEGNLDEAIEVFEKVVEEYRVSPGMINLLKECIERENTDKIQIIMDTGKKINSEMNNVYRLAFAFLELGKVKQAEKIFQTPGLRNTGRRMENQCKYLVRNGKISQVENLIKVTKNLFGVDRTLMYYYLLQGYINTDDSTKALRVWVTMQEEGVDPSNEFLITLADFLTRKGEKVPFVVPLRPVTTPGPSPASNQVSTSPPVREQERKKQTQPSPERMREELLKSLKEHLNSNNVNEAIAISKSLLSKGYSVKPQLLRRLFRKLSEVPDLAALHSMENYMDKDLKYQTFYPFHLGVSYVNADKIEELLNKCLHNLESTSKTEYLLPEISGVILNKICQERTQHIPLVKRVAEAVKEKGQLHLYSKLWDAYFANGNLPEAQEIYENHLKDIDDLSVKSTCYRAYSCNDTEKLGELLKILNMKEKGRENAKGIVYTTLVKLLNKNEQFEEALKVIEDSLTSITLDHYHRKDLVSLEKKMKVQNQTFPYDLSKVSSASKVSSSSSSSSSSDEEKDKK